jgi:hypothetical protein
MSSGTQPLLPPGSLVSVVALAEPVARWEIQKAQTVLAAKHVLLLLMQQANVPGS